MDKPDDSSEEEKKTLIGLLKKVNIEKKVSIERKR